MTCDNSVARKYWEMLLNGFCVSETGAANKESLSAPELPMQSWEQTSGLKR